MSNDVKITSALIYQNLERPCLLSMWEVYPIDDRGEKCGSLGFLLDEDEAEQYRFSQNNPLQYRIREVLTVHVDEAVYTVHTGPLQVISKPGDETVMFKRGN